MSGPVTEVEQPFLDQLILMGWKYITGSLTDATVTGRESPSASGLLEPDLERAVAHIGERESGRAAGAHPPTRGFQ